MLSRFEPPPLPLYAEVLSVGFQYAVVFDAPLEPDTLDPANWVVTHGRLDYPATVATSLGSVVTITVGPSSAGMSPDGISYAASPADLLGHNGVPVDPFFKVPFL